MDIIGTILARNGIKEIKASGGVGYTTQNIASFVIPAAEEVTSDVSLMGVNFKWFSSLTPTQEEFLAGTWIISKDGKSLSYPIKNFANVAATANGAYCVNMGGHLYIVSTVLENELGKLPKTGMYYSTTLSNDDENAGLTYIFEFAETIHPIDPKYIPGAVLPVVELSTVIENEVSLTEIESAQLSKAYDNKLPVIIRFPYSGAVVCSILYSIYVEGAMEGYTGSFPDFKLALLRVGDAWTTLVETV